MKSSETTDSYTKGWFFFSPKMKSGDDPKIYLYAISTFIGQKLRYLPHFEGKCVNFSNFLKKFNFQYHLQGHVRENQGFHEKHCKMVKKQNFPKTSRQSVENVLNYPQLDLWGPTAIPTSWKFFAAGVILSHFEHFWAILAIFGHFDLPVGVTRRGPGG